MARTITIVAWIIVLGIVLMDAARGQHCALEVSGLNKDRKVFGPISTECPGGEQWPIDIPIPYLHFFPKIPESLGHTAPFGNWGVNSNHGDREDGHQFQGWCKNFFCTLDAFNQCYDHCTDGWYEWNSCTISQPWSPGHQEFYNADNSTTQVSAPPFGDDGGWQPVNKHGTRVIKMFLGQRREDACPHDTTGDGRCDTGGCLDLDSYASRTNHMILYELDPWDDDERVHRMDFDYPSTNDLVVDLTCDAWGCNPDPVQSAWVSPSSHLPILPVRVTAKLSIRVERAWFDDADDKCEPLRTSDPRYDCH